MYFSVPTYKNPVYVPDGASVINIADPTIIKYNGEYYLYGTSDIPGFNVFHSRDLVNWEYKGVAYSGPPSNGIFEGVWNIDWFWAPAIHYENGKFYLYYSAGDPSKGAESRNIGVAISDNPLGPFRDYENNPIVTDINSIDGFVFVDEDGEKYFYYNQVGGGFNGIAVRHMKDPFSFDTEETRVISISEPWEEVINEGPVILKKNGKYYLMYSGGNYADKSYAVGYATADKPISNLGMADNLTWKKYEKNPIMKTNESAISPGHNDITFAPNNVCYYIVYHTKRYEETGPQRQLAIDRLYFNYDKLFTYGPTADNRPIPEKPDFQDWFDGKEEKVKEPWRIIKGEFLIKENELISNSNDGFIVNDKVNSNSYVYEVNMKINSYNKNSKAGFVSSYLDENNNVAVTLDPYNKKIILKYVYQGKEKIIEKKLKDNFKEDTYHQYLLYKNGNLIKLYIDKVLYFTERININNGNIGLFFEKTDVTYDGIAYTTYFEDNFDNDTGLFSDLKILNGELLIEKGKEKIVNEDLTNYEMGFDFRYEENKKHKFFVSYIDNKNYIGVSVKDDNIIIEKAINGRIYNKRFRVKDLFKEKLNLREYHSLRVVKINEVLGLYLDGVEICKIDWNISKSHIGINSLDSIVYLDNFYILKLNF